MITEPGLVGATGHLGAIERSHRERTFATFRHDEAATARVARLKPMRKCEGESDE
jgi:hypothetical protein